MKLFTTIYLLAAVFFFKSTSSASDTVRVSPSPWEVALNCNAIYHRLNGSTNDSTNKVLFNDLVEFDTNKVLLKDWVDFDTITNISMEVSFRNVGEKWVWPNVLVSGLSIVWNGKEYKLAHPEDYFQSEGWAVAPKTSWHRSFLVSDFLIPQEALIAGRHTVAVRDVFSETNTITYSAPDHWVHSKSDRQIFAESGTLTVFTKTQWNTKH